MTGERGSTRSGALKRFRWAKPFPRTGRALHASDSHFTKVLVPPCLPPISNDKRARVQWADLPIWTMLFATASGGRLHDKEQAQADAQSSPKMPDLEQSKSAVLNSLTSPSSQRSY